MKCLFPVLAFLLCGLPPAFAQTPLASSTPVIGFYKFDVPAGTSAWTCGFVTKKQYQGLIAATVAGTTKSTISIATPAWTPASFDLHYVEILSGPQAGLIIDIDPATPNTANQLTVIGKTTGTGGLGLTGTESFCIRRHATLGTILKNGAGLQPFSDLVTLIDDEGKGTPYGFDGTGWVDGVGFVVPANDKIVYPGQGYLITAGSPVQITIGGDAVAYVHSGPLKIPVYGGKRNLVGILNPLVSTDPADPRYAASSVPGASLGMVEFLDPFSGIISTYTTDGALRTAGVFGTDGVYLVDGVDFFTDRSNAAFRNGTAFAVTPPADKLYTQPALLP